MSRQMVPVKLARREVRRARRVYLQTQLGTYRISRAEALRVLKPAPHIVVVPIQRWMGSLCIDTYGPYSE